MVGLGILDDLWQLVDPVSLAKSIWSFCGRTKAVGWSLLHILIEGEGCLNDLKCDMVLVDRTVGPTVVFTVTLCTYHEIVQTDMVEARLVYGEPKLCRHGGGLLHLEAKIVIGVEVNVV